MTCRSLLPLLLATALGCASSSPPAHDAHAAHEEGALEAVTRAHGGAGPWAVSGYRMGRFALQRLGVPRGSFDLEVIHHSPREVQYSCVADGAGAATGASLGRLSLTLAAAKAEDVHTTFRRKSTGAQVTLRPAAAFVARYRDVPREGLAAAGREVLTLPDDAVFEVVDEGGH